MKINNFSVKKKISLLSLGAESAGVFAVYKNSNIFISQNYGDLLDNANFLKYKSAVSAHIKREKIKPNAIITDLHPLYNSTILGEILAKKYKIIHIKVQHHLAHIFSAIGDYLLNIQYPIFNIQTKIPNAKCQIPNTIIGIAADGTGYGLDGNIWGGEVFKITNYKSQITNKFKIQNSKINDKKSNFDIERIGSLEEQTMIGGDLAVREPARMLIAILAKILNSLPCWLAGKFQTCSVPSRRILNKLQITNYKLQTKSKTQNPNFKKEFIYPYVKKYYTRNEFEVLYSQLEQNFNCQKTTSAGRVLDAAAVLLEFAGNERNFKHEAAKLLEANSTTPYFLEPKINPPKSPFCKGGQRWILETTPLFEYLLRNIYRDKKRLAATAQEYIAKGFYEIIKKIHDSRFTIQDSCFFAGGMANNKIISSYLEHRGVYISKKIPRGDEGIAVGQIIYYLLNNNH